MKIDEINCWDGYKKKGTKAGTGKNKGKRVNNCVKEDAGQIADVAAMAAIAGMAYPLMLAMIKGAFKTGRGLLKLQKIAQEAGVKLADKLVPTEPLEEDWFDIYKQYTSIDDKAQSDLKDIHTNFGHDNFDPNDEDAVKRFIDAQSPEYLDWYAKNYGSKMDNFSQTAAEVGYDWNAGGMRDQMISRGIDRNEIGKLYDLRDMVKTDYPDAYELIKQGKGKEAWELLKTK